jgi:hypothetical protein
MRMGQFVPFDKMATEPMGATQQGTPVGGFGAMPTAREGKPDDRTSYSAVLVLCGRVRMARPSSNLSHRACSRTR